MPLSPLCNSLRSCGTASSLPQAESHTPTIPSLSFCSCDRQVRGGDHRVGDAYNSFPFTLATAVTLLFASELEEHLQFLSLHFTLATPAPNAPPTQHTLPTIPFPSFHSCDSDDRRLFGMDHILQFLSLRFTLATQHGAARDVIRAAPTIPFRSFCSCDLCGQTQGKGHGSTYNSFPFILLLRPAFAGQGCGHGTPLQFLSVHFALCDAA